MRHITSRLAARRVTDDGFAVPFVLFTMFILTAFLLTSLGMVLNQTAPSRADQDAKAALAAAQAGIDEYISRLSANSEYWARGNVDAANGAFTAAGVDVPGTGGRGAAFRYRVLTDAAVTAQQGYIDLEVTGSSQPAGGGRMVERTLTARLEPSGFLDFIYYTDFETIDPSLLGYSETNREICSHYHYDRYRVGSTTYNNRPDGTCPIINWTSGDVVIGPMHSNDALYVGGSVRFANPRTESSWVKTSDPSRLWRGPGTPIQSGGATPGYWPRYSPPIDLPDANTGLLKYVRPVVDSSSNPDTAAARPGCLYRGATSIEFVGTQMRVLSPNTRSAPSYCYNTSASARGTVQTLAIPPVIHVAPTSGSCSGVGYPRAGEDTSNRRTTEYDNCHGTAFVQGNADAQVTVSAEDDIVVTADITVEDETETDVVGLVAGNYVWVYHPVRDDGSNLLASTAAVRNIEAAVLSLRHSFVVQNWDAGAPLSSSATSTKLRVYGAIAQKFRGPVGTGNATAPATGYLKNYIYDDRFQVLQPPYFLAPEDAPWVAAKITDG